MNLHLICALGVRTMSIIEKGIWDDVFPIEGGGLVHMKLQFFLSEEERTRVRLMRESAMKKKQADILDSRNEETKEKISDDVKETNEESTSNKNDAILQQQAEVPEELQEDTKTRDYLKNNNAVKSEPLKNRVEQLDKQILEDNKPSFVKKMSKESKFPPLAKETEVNTIKNNAIQLQETDVLKRLQDSSSSDVGSSRLPVAEKMESLEKTPQNIKKMISVFESTIYQDRVPLKPVSAKSYRFGTSRLLKDYYEKSTSLKNSEDSSSSRLRNSFSTGDLRKNLSNVTTEGDQVDREGVNDEKERVDGRKSSKFNLDYFGQDGSGQWAFLDERRHFCITAQGDKTFSLSSDWKIEGKGHQEKDEEIENPESENVVASNGSFGQVMKIALVVGFGALAFFSDKGNLEKERKRKICTL